MAKKAAKKKSIFNIDSKAKVVNISKAAFEAATSSERAAIKSYKDSGYEINVISPKRTGDTLKNAEIEEKLAGDKSALEKYKAIKKEEGFFKARKWAKDYIEGK